MTGRRPWRRELLGAALALSSVHGASFATDAVISTSFLFQAWTVHTTDGQPQFQQDTWAIQVHSLRLRGPLTLQGYLPIATTSDDQNGFRLSGTGDAQVRVSWHQPASRWRATLGVDLPTGQTELEEREYRVVAPILASQVLDFQLKRLGEGRDLFGSVSCGIPLGRNTMAGLALGAALNSEYTLYKTVEGLEQRVQPGNRLHASASLLAQEHDLDPDWDLAMTLACEIPDHTELRLEDRVTTVIEGIQGRLNTTYAHRIGQDDRVSISALLSARDRNHSPDVVIPEVEYLGISLRYVAQAGVSYTVVRTHWPRLTMSAIASVFRIDPWSSVDSYVVVPGIDVEQPLRPWAALYALARIGFGSTVWETTGGDDEPQQEDCDLGGMGLGAGLRFAL